MKHKVPMSVWTSLWLIVAIMIMGGAATLINHIFVISDSIAQRTYVIEEILYLEANIKAATQIAIALITAYSLLVSNKHYLFICSIVLFVTNVIPFTFNISSMSSAPGVLSAMHLSVMFFIALLSGYSAYKLRQIK